mmetsp:Transcript_21936/g.32845  ORF Transcript_21936/g.32845 Transcript_21936/m.32845 type:complete len:229 (+) Transcript_21936:57-743(+)
MYRHAKQPVMLLTNALLGKTHYGIHKNGSSAASARRWVSTCLHIKGIPFAIPKKTLYTFFKSHYGEIRQLAVYNEVSPNASNAKVQKKRNMIYHKRPPGQTAIINFKSTNSAIMCKEELHWRPFPLLGVDEGGGDYIHRPFLERDTVDRSPRDRPIVNILFETTFMRSALRPWIKLDLTKSKNLMISWDIIERRKRLKLKAGDNGDNKEDAFSDINVKDDHDTKLQNP